MNGVRAATTETFRLAEGPHWDAARQRLLWVDILGRQVLAGRLHDGLLAVEQRIAFDVLVGAVTAAADGSLLVAAQETLIVVGPDGGRRPGPRIVAAGQSRRLNDGKTDPAGRFVVGTLSLTGRSEQETLVRLEDDGQLTTIDDDLTLSNGLAWSTDGRRMFSVDTWRQAIYVRDYDPASGATGPRRTFATVDEAYPDGIAVDAADHLWVAVWGAGEVRRYSPTGDVVGRTAVPALHASSVGFAGPDLRLLVITTAADGLTAEQLRQHPDSGRLFTMPVDVPGHPAPAWAGADI